MTATATGERVTVAVTGPTDKEALLTGARPTETGDLPGKTGNLRAVTGVPPIQMTVTGDLPGKTGSPRTVTGDHPTMTGATAVVTGDLSIETGDRPTVPAQPSETDDLDADRQRVDETREADAAHLVITIGAAPPCLDARPAGLGAAPAAAPTAAPEVGKQSHASPALARTKKLISHTERRSRSSGIYFQSILTRLPPRRRSARHWA